jgi:protein-arginine kinase activator protein McsA
MKSMSSEKKVVTKKKIRKRTERATLQKVCEHCGLVFYAIRNSRKFCSASCRQLSGREQKKEEEKFEALATTYIKVHNTINDQHNNLTYDEFLKIIQTRHREFRELLSNY